MRFKTSKGIAVMCAVMMLGMGAFAGSASAAFDYYWDGLLAPGGVSSPNHTLTQASTRTISGQAICVQSYHASDNTRAGPASCNAGVNALVSIDYPCVCTLMHAYTAVTATTNIRARVDF